MSVYLRAKFQVSSVTLTSFRQGGGGNFKKCNKLIGLIKRLSVNLPCNALLTIYKFFIRYHLDYGYILYDNPNNENF